MFVSEPIPISKKQTIEETGVTPAMETRSEPGDLAYLAPSYAAHGNGGHGRCIAHD